MRLLYEISLFQANFTAFKNLNVMNATYQEICLLNPIGKAPSTLTFSCEMYPTKH